jgi:hypothetical protein
VLTRPRRRKDPAEQLESNAIHGFLTAGRRRDRSKAVGGRDLLSAAARERRGRGSEGRKEKTRGGRRGIVEGHAWISRCGVGSGFQEIGCRARVGLWSLDTIGSGLNRLLVPPNKKEINSTTLAS